MSDALRNRLSARFVFLSDQEGQLLDQLNIRHINGYRGKDIALPTAILVDKDGIVRWVYEMAYGNVRMIPKDLFEAIERMTLEEQNRTLLRSRAVSKVVKQVFLMEKSADLGSVIQLMQKELQGLAFRFSFCGITIFDEEASLSRTYGATSGDSLPGTEDRDRSEPVLLPHLELPLSGHADLEQVVSAWRKGDISYLNVESVEESYLYELGSSTLAGKSQIKLPIRCVLHVPFAHGALVLGGTNPDQFAADDIRTLTEFAEAISVGYQRFLDFQELDRRNRELQETQLQLVQSEKMASLGELVAGIVHEFNTPLGVIKSSTQSATNAVEAIRGSLDSLGSSEENQKRRLGNILGQLETLTKVNGEASQRMIQIVDSLRSFARLDEAEWKLADPHRGLEDTLTLIQHKLGNRIQVTREYGNLPAIPCYPRQLNQVFMTLLSNAVEAIEGDGEITIRTYLEDDQANIQLTDTGRGIPQEILGRIFDPGFTTRGVGVGTGLGLSICYQIMQMHQGRIEVTSRVGQGSTFTVTLPKHQNPR